MCMCARVYVCVLLVVGTLVGAREGVVWTVTLFIRTIRTYISAVLIRSTQFAKQIRL